MPRARKPPANKEHYLPEPPPIYVLTYKTNNPAIFILPATDAIISAHETKAAAMDAARTWMANMLEQQKQLEEEEKDEQGRRVKWEDEEGWHTGEWADLDGSWKSMINAKGGFKDLVVCVRRYEPSYKSDGKGDT